MAIKSSGPLGIEADIIKEFTHLDNGDPHSLTEYYGKNIITQLNDVTSTYYLPAGKIPQGLSDEPLPMSSYYGVELVFSLVLNTTIQQLDLYNFALNNGWNGYSPMDLFVPDNIAIWSDDTSTAALNIVDVNTRVNLYVNGAIIGRGGDGGSASSSAVTVENNGKPGGAAIYLSGETSLDITIGGANGFIAGGGGGGGGGSKDGLGDGFLGLDNREPRVGGGGGGSGGGRGGNMFGGSGGVGLVSGGAGGTVGNYGSAGAGYGIAGGAGGAGGGGGGNWNDRKARQDHASAGGGGGRVLNYSNIGGFSADITRGSSRDFGGNGGGWGAAGGNGGGGTGGIGGAAIITANGNLRIVSGSNRIFGAY